MASRVTPQVLEASNRFRAQLLAGERRAASAMVRYYGTVWAQLQGQIGALAGEVAELQASGADVGVGMLWRLERLKAIQQQVEDELGQFTAYAAGEIAAGKRTAVAGAERDAAALIGASFPGDAGIEISFKMMPKAAVEALVGFLADGSPLADLITQAVGDAADDFMQTLVTGLAAGWNPRKLARKLRSAFGMGLTRALRIARTEQLRAYRTATLDAYRRSGVVTAWERHADRSTRTCMACILLDGKRYALDEPMDDHVQGRCAMLPITLTYAELGIDAPEPDFSRELGRDWFLRQDQATQIAMMGQGMWDAWQAGDVDLDDIPTLIEDDTWGNSWVPASLTSLTGGQD